MTPAPTTGAPTTGDPTTGLAALEVLALLNLGAFLLVCGSILAGLWHPPLALAEALAIGELALALAGLIWLILSPPARQSRAARLVARHAPGWKRLVQ